MQASSAIEAFGLAKQYDVGVSRLDALIRVLKGGPSNSPTGFWALRDVSFEIERGTALAIIGSNGSGKSTLLRILSGTVVPTLGHFNLAGTLSGILELSGGFNGLQTGRENVERTLVIEAGLRRKEARSRMGEVAKFADLGAFLDRPVRTYSDGMRLRLAFAAMTLVQPDILLTDEVIAVGDEPFQRKCESWFQRFMARGGTLVIASHDLARVQETCSRALWLDRGRVRAIGEAREVVRAYRDSLYDDATSVSVGVEHRAGEVIGLPCEVVALELLSEEGRETRQLAVGSSVTVRVTIRAQSCTHVPHVHIGFTKQDLTPVYGVSSDMVDAAPQQVDAQHFQYEVRFERLPIRPGSYRLRVHALDETATRLYDTVEEFFVVGDVPCDDGLIRMDWQFD